MRQKLPIASGTFSRPVAGGCANAGTYPPAPNRNAFCPIPAGSAV